jgi:hypothetical protein
MNATMLQQLINLRSAGDLLSAQRAKAAPAGVLTHLLYTTCERKGWADEARSYKGFAVTWPALEKVAASVTSAAQLAQQEPL